MSMSSLLSRVVSPICLLLLCFSIGTSSLVAGSFRQTGQTENQSFRVVRTVSGSAVAQQGNELVVQDQREVFHVPDDHQVLVVFTWEGPLGSHHLQGSWKDPT